MQELDKILAFLADHPALWPLAIAIVWPVVTAPFNVLLNRLFPKDEAGWRVLYAESPRISAAVQLLRHAGFNVPAAVEAARALLSGKPPAWVNRLPPPRSHEDLVAELWRLEPAVRDAVIAALARQPERDAAPLANDDSPPVTT